MDGGAAEGAAEGEGATLALGDGVGCSPTGSGPANTSAATIAAPTMMPSTSPAMTVRRVFLRREGTSTDGRDRHPGGR
jgi:hypothetical protein